MTLLNVPVGPRMTEALVAPQVALASTPGRLLDAWRARSPQTRDNQVVPIIIIVAIIVLLALAATIVAAAIILCAQRGGVLESVVNVWDGYVKITCKRI